MSDRKLSKGTYYSCPRQELSKNNCSTCVNESEKEREKESKLKEEYKQKDQRYFELAKKKKNSNLEEKKCPKKEN